MCRGRVVQGVAVVGCLGGKRFRVKENKRESDEGEGRLDADVTVRADVVQYAINCQVQWDKLDKSCSLSIPIELPYTTSSSPEYAERGDEKGMYV
jgi:hypothetical protein